MYNVFQDVSLTVIGLLRALLYKRKNINKYYDDEYQFKKLKRLLTISRNVSYYNRLFNKIKFNPKRDFNRIEDIQKIPITTKKDLIANYSDIFNSKYTKSALEFRTSGTTGVPFKSLTSKKHWIVEQGCIWSHWLTAGYKYGDHVAILRSHKPKKSDEIIKHDKIRNWTYYSPYHTSDIYLMRYWEDMMKKSVRMLRGYPSSLSLFADYCRRNELKLPSLRACLTASETLSQSERSLIENTFGVNVYDHYGLAETVVMLHNYGGNSSYQNHNDYGYLELIPTDDDNLYRIIGTNLHNYAMPLIRYDTGDLARVTKGNDGGYTITDIVGRKDQYIQSPNGRIPTVNIYTIMYKIEGIVQWQVVQENEKTIDVYIVVNELFGEHESAELERSFELMDLEVTIHKVNELVKTGEGKVRPFISHIE